MTLIKKLIPALMRYDPANNPPGHKSNQAIRYRPARRVGAGRGGTGG